MKDYLKQFEQNKKEGQEDFYVYGASLFFSVPYEEITKDQRRQFKESYLGFMYGSGSGRG